jgi:hypothetical protein
MKVTQVFEIEGCFALKRPHQNYSNEGVGT